MTMLLLEWVITSIFLILTVLALRAAFGKRVSARLRYALWAVVLARLLVPVQLFTSPLAGTRFFSESRTEQTVTQWPITSDAHATPGPDDILSPNLPGEPLTDFPAAPQAPEPPTVSIITPAAPAAPDLTKAPAWLGWTWLGGSIALVLVLAASNLRFVLRLRRSRIPLEEANCPLPVYAAAGLPSPCLFGLIRPAVYVTPEAAADPAMLRHVLAHEYTHFRQGDHFWSLLRCAALAAHWWNPLVWLAVKLSRRDGELACDEGALKRLGDGERLAYGNTLLALVTAKPAPGDLLCFATTMAGEKKSLKERISRIACAPKRWLWAAVAVVLVMVLACACAFSAAEEPEQTDGPDAEPTPSEMTGPEPTPSEEVYLTASLTFSLDENEEGTFVRIAGSVDGIELEHTRWFDYTLFNDISYPPGWLLFEMPLCGGKAVGLAACWMDESRTVVRVTAAPTAMLSSYAPSGNLVFTVDLRSGTVLELDGYIPKLSANDPELVPSEAEAVRTARVAAKLLAEAEAYYQSRTGHSQGGEPIEPPIIEPPLVLEGGECAMIIAEVLETTSESAVMWDIEYTKISCRLVYGYKASLYRYDYEVSEQGEFALYLSDNALRQLGQAEMLLLCLPKYSYPPYKGYAADYIIPIADGCMVLEEEWRYSLPVIAMNEEIQSLADKRACGEKLSKTEQLAPTSPLETGMTVEEVIAFLDTWEKYCAQVSADFSARRAELYG